MPRFFMTNAWPDIIGQTYRKTPIFETARGEAATSASLLDRRNAGNAPETLIVAESDPRYRFELAWSFLDTTQAADIREAIKGAYGGWSTLRFAEWFRTIHTTTSDDGLYPWRGTFLPQSLPFFDIVDGSVDALSELNESYDFDIVRAPIPWEGLTDTIETSTEVIYLQLIGRRVRDVRIVQFQAPTRRHDGTGLYQASVLLEEPERNERTVIIQTLDLEEG